MPREIVSLENAWFWSCPACSKDNYERSMESSIDEMDEETVRTLLELEPWEEVPTDVEGRFFAAPETVRCVHCSAEFDCFVPDAPGEDEDGDAPDDQDPPKIPDGLPEDFGNPPG